MLSFTIIISALSSALFFSMALVALAGDALGGAIASKLVTTVCES